MPKLTLRTTLAANLTLLQILRSRPRLLIVHQHNDTGDRSAEDGDEEQDEKQTAAVTEAGMNGVFAAARQLRLPQGRTRRRSDGARV